MGKQPFMASLFKEIEPEFGQHFRHGHKWS